MRDKFVWWACNFLLDHVATEWYRNWIGRTQELGMQQIKKMAEERNA